TLGPKPSDGDVFQGPGEQHHLDANRARLKEPAQPPEDLRVAPVAEVRVLAAPLAFPPVHPAGLSVAAPVVPAAATAPLALGGALEVENRGSHGEAPRLVAWGHRSLQGVGPTRSIC